MIFAIRGHNGAADKSEVICPSRAPIGSISALPGPIVGRFCPRGKTEFANSPNIFRRFKAPAQNKSVAENQKV